MIISEKSIAKKLKQKRKVVQSKPIELNDNFQVQNNFILDPNRFVVAQCSRRAGKTNGLAMRFFKTLEKHPKSQCIYLGLTLDSARDIMWPVLQELNERYGLGCKFIESRLTMTHPNGAKLRLFGADMSNFIKRLKGRKYPGAAVDEAQDFGPHLQSLVDDVLTPSIADYEDGWIALTGTPGPVPNGYFFDITERHKFGYSLHSWTLLENPHMPKPAEFIKDLLIKREWSDNNPTYLREYKNQWVLDVESLWIKYKENVNHYQTLDHTKKWNYILGVDLGFKDSDALAVLAWADDSPTTYLVEELVTPQQGLTELAEQIKYFDEKYKFDKMVVDEGALGKKLAEELRRRHHIPVQPAEKTRKQETVEFLNDSLRLGQFKAKSASRFAKDSYLVQIDWDKSRSDKIVIKKKPHSDIIDAVIYAYKESPAFTYRKPVEPPKYGTREWALKQEEEMFEGEMEALRKQKDDLSYYD
jgi:hypothetical protein